MTITDKRQRDLDAWFTVYPHPSVEAIYYKNRRSQYHSYLRRLGDALSPDELEQCLHEPVDGRRAFIPKAPPLFGLGIPVPVFVGHDAYKDFSEPELHSILRYHEFQHADDLVHGITLRDATRIGRANAADVREPVLDLLFESRAIASELRQMLAEGRRGTLFENAQDIAFQQYRLARNMPPQTPLELRILKDTSTALMEILPRLPGFVNQSFRR